MQLPVYAAEIAEITGVEPALLENTRRREKSGTLTE
jgi:hypothetical protein